MFDVILCFITAFALTYYLIPPIIRIARTKHLFDEPTERGAHTYRTPTLGGIAIFAGVLFSIVFWTPFNVFNDLQYILGAFIIIFLIGAKDDIEPISARSKLIGQIFAAGILVFKSNIMLTSLYGVMGIYDIPEWAGILLTMFTILVTINAFNLIDGINGLAGSVGALIALFFGSWFLLIDRIEFALIAFSLAGSTIAFLKYNFTPARIFMGDTGSLLIGTVCAILVIQFIETHKELPLNPYTFNAVPSVAIGILILPLFDTFRVFLTRAIRGNSPFKPDRRHIHHLLIDSGFNHTQATIILVIVNVLFIILVCYFQHLGTFNLLLLVLGLASGLTAILHWFAHYDGQHEKSLT